MNEGYTLEALLQSAQMGPVFSRGLGALVIVVGAWIVSRLVSALLLKAAHVGHLESRLGRPGLAQVLAQVAAAAVWLVALPPLLGVLHLQALLDPVNVMMSRLMGFVPNLLGAGVVLGLGWLAARILSQIVEGLLKAAGSERLVSRFGLQNALGTATLASLVGSLVFALIMLPTVAAFFQALELEAIARPVGQMLQAVAELIPRVLSALVIIMLGALVGRLLGNLVGTVLAGVGVDQWPARMGLPAQWRVAGRVPSEWLGSVVMTAFVVAAVTQACQVLGFDVLTEAVASLGGVMARLFAAGLVLALGLWLSVLAAQSVMSSGMQHAAMWARLARLSVLFFTIALALRQSGLPGDIIVVAFGCMVGAVCLGLALALGLGGRDVAARLLSAWADRYLSARPSRDDDGV